MGYGQYSTQGQERKSKTAMLAELKKEVVASKLIGRNTLAYETATYRAVRYHNTDVFVIGQTGHVCLDTGGWNTVTTRERINDALHGSGFRIFTDRGALFLSAPDGSNHEFVETVKFNVDSEFSKLTGGILNRPGGFEFRPGDIYTDIRFGQAVSYKHISKLIDKYLAVLNKGGVPTNTGGDPWVSPDPKTGKYSREHVMEWLSDPDTKQPYVFGTFIVNALRFSGMTDVGISMYLSDFNKRKQDGYHSALVIRKVRRYIRACLGYAT